MPKAESREPKAESRKPKAESREPKAESRKPRAESREPSYEVPKLHTGPEAVLPAIVLDTIFQKYDRPGCSPVAVSFFVELGETVTSFIHSGGGDEVPRYTSARWAHSPGFHDSTTVVGCPLEVLAGPT